MSREIDTSDVGGGVADEQAEVERQIKRLDNKMELLERRAADGVDDEVKRRYDAACTEKQFFCAKRDKLKHQKAIPRLPSVTTRTISR